MKHWHVQRPYAQSIHSHTASALWQNHRGLHQYSPWIFYRGCWALTQKVSAVRLFTSGIAQVLKVVPHRKDRASFRYNPPRCSVLIAAGARHS
jgi:hypothetical protein